MDLLGSVLIKLVVTPTVGRLDDEGIFKAYSIISIKAGRFGVIVVVAVETFTINIIKPDR